MRSAEQRRLAPVATLLLALGLAACGGGNSSTTTIIGGASGVGVSVDTPTGPNTTEVVVDAGPGGGFAAAATNLPYVTVTVCEPAPSTRCVEIDHVFLDTGSIGLRLLRSTVQALALPAVTVGGKSLAECYPFVIGAVWGPVAQADLRIGGEQAGGVPVQLIDDLSPALAPPPADCSALADGGLLQSQGALQAKGVLGIGLLQYDCGLGCQQGDYSGGAVPYYACDGQGGCTLTAVAPAQQVQNPVVFFPVDNNGTLIVLPALPAAGAALAKGRLVFGIGTQTNNQIDPAAQILRVDPDPASTSYLYLGTSIGATRYPNAYVDSGSNGLFFDDATLGAPCAGGWYCPTPAARRDAVIDDVFGARRSISFTITSADALFATGNLAFADLGGTAGASNAGAFVWGLPFFFGRPVYTAIWGQALAAGGPWYAF